MYISKNFKIFLLFAVFLFGIFLFNNVSTQKVSALGPTVTWCPGEPGNCNHPKVPGSNPQYALCGGSGCITSGLPSGYSASYKGCEGPQQDCDTADVQLNPGQIATQPCGWTNSYKIFGPGGGLFDYIAFYSGDCATPPVNPNNRCSQNPALRYRVFLKNGTQTDWITSAQLTSQYTSVYKLDQFDRIIHGVFIGNVSNNVRFYGRVRLLTPNGPINYYDANAGTNHRIPVEYFLSGNYSLRIISQHPNDSSNSRCSEHNFTILPPPLACGANGCNVNSDCASGNSCVSGQCRLTQCATSPGSCNSICSPKTNVSCSSVCYDNGIPNSQGTCQSGNSCTQGTDGRYTCKRTQCISNPASCAGDGCTVYTQCGGSCIPGGDGTITPTPDPGIPGGPIIIDPPPGGAVMGVAATQSSCAPGFVCSPSTSRCVLQECFNGTASCDTNQCVATCTPTLPAQATLSFPINDARVGLGINNSVNFSFVLNSYGQGCPVNTNSYSLQLNQVEIGQSCGASYVSYGQVTSVNNLLPNKKYCWRVYKANGSRDVLSSVGTFNTFSDAVTVSQNNSVLADVCGSGYSGKFGNPNVTNPIEFNISATKSNSTSTFREIWIAMIRNNVTNQEVMSLDSIRTKVNTERNMGFRYVLAEAPQQPQVFTMSSAGGGWSNAGISSDGTSIANGDGTASVIEVGTSTLFTVTSDTVSGKVKIRFNDSHFSSLYNVYAAVIFTGENGLLYSSDSQTANQFNFRRLRTKAGGTNWGVDLINPGATVSAPTYNQDGTFNVNWSSTDNLSGMKNYVDSYIAATEEGSLINVSDVGDVTPFIGALPTPPTPSNGGITTTALTTKTYRDLKPELGSEFTFSMHVEDNACNKTSTNSQSVGTQPWLLSYKGSVSSNAGIIGVLPSQVSFQIPGTNDINSNFISTYTLISGSSLPARKLSKYDQYTRDYFNTGALPPSDSGFTSWYDYTYNLTQKNLAVANNKGTLNGPVIFNSGNMSQVATTVNGAGVVLSFAGPQNGNNYIVINGNATFNSGFVCDRKLTIFVTGNITINPDFNVGGANCVFIARGDIAVTNGINKTENVALISATPASYDLLNGYFVTDSNFVTSTDNINGPIRKWDGIQINGGVVAKDIVLQRSINLSANALQPATIVIYDPKYREDFGFDFSFNKYSVREDGI